MTISRIVLCIMYVSVFVLKAWSQQQAITASMNKLQANFPSLMLKTNDGLYINIHEAAFVNYPPMQLHVNVNAYSLSCTTLKLKIAKGGRTAISVDTGKTGSSSILVVGI